MRERAEEVIDGVRLMLHGVRWGRGLIAIEDNKPEAIAAMQKAAKGYGQIKVVPVPALYPMGSEKQMIKTLTGLEVPAGGLTAQVGVLVHNVATAFAVHEALRYGRPLVRRVVTVSGGAVRDRRNLDVPIGTLVEDLLDYCGLDTDPARLLMGGPMMGTVLPHARVPIVKGSNGVLALTAPELSSGETMPCFRCGSCVKVCPVGLVPLEMMKRAEAGDFDGALAYGLSDCISCGTCAYACPANLPLTQYFNYAKGAIAVLAENERKMTLTKELAAQRQTRIEAQEAEKARKKAERAAARAAKKQQQAEEVPS
jgi:electron transport complex protein RnfC